MYSLVFTETARQDYINIANYILTESKSIITAKRYIKKLQNQIETLQEFPNMGNLPKDRFLLSVGYRFLVCDDYLTFYKVFEPDKKVVVYTVVNGKRDYRKILQNI